MARLDDLLRVQPHAYAEEARNWQRVAEGIRDRGADLERQIKKLDSWSGATAEQAKAKLSGYRKQYGDAAAVMAKLPPVLDEAARQFGAAQREAWRLDDEARSAGWKFDPDGRVVPRVGPPAPMGGLEPRAQRLEEAMRGHIATVTRTDADTADAVRRLSAQAAGLAPPDQATVAAAATTIPARATAPADVRKWWDSLTPIQRESLLFTHAGAIGALDGVPAVARDRANRTNLAEVKGPGLRQSRMLVGLTC